MPEFQEIFKVTFSNGALAEQTSFEEKFLRHICTTITLAGVSA